MAGIVPGTSSCLTEIMAEWKRRTNDYARFTAFHMWQMLWMKSTGCFENR